MTIRFLKLSLASPESIRSWTERTLSNGNKVGKILKGDLIDYKNGLPIRDGLNCERIFGPVVSYTCSCGRFKCFETRGINIVHDYGVPARFDNKTRIRPSANETKGQALTKTLNPIKESQNFLVNGKNEIKPLQQNLHIILSNHYLSSFFFKGLFPYWQGFPCKLVPEEPWNGIFFPLPQKLKKKDLNTNKNWSFFGARYIDITKIYVLDERRKNSKGFPVRELQQNHVDNPRKDEVKEGRKGEERKRRPLPEPLEKSLGQFKKARKKKSISFSISAFIRHISNSTIPTKTRSTSDKRGGTTL